MIESTGISGRLPVLSAHVNEPQSAVHVDQHALAFLPGSSSILVIGNDGGVHGTTNADAATQTIDPTWFNMDTGINTIEFYSGDISGNLPMLLLHKQVADRRTTARSQYHLTGHLPDQCYGSWAKAATGFTHASIR